MSRRRKTPSAPGWTPLVRMTPKPWTDEKRAELRATTLATGLIAPEVIDDYMVRTEREQMEHEVWGNNRYMIHVERRFDGSIDNLSIRRQDRKAIRDWRDLQRIKNELAGYEAEAVELFPADSRLVDSANQYWLWCLPPGERFPYGFTTRFVGDTETGGSRQRPLPDDEVYTFQGGYVYKPAASGESAQSDHD